MGKPVCGSELERRGPGSGRPSPSDNQTRQAAQLGFATRLLFESQRVTFRLGSVRVWLWPAIRLEQIEVDFDRKGNPTGFATWAFLSDEVAAAMINDPNRMLHLSEWNEGTNLWIIDVVAPRGLSRYLLERLRDRLGGVDRVHGVRRDEHGDIRRAVNVGVRRRRTDREATDR